MVLSWTEVKALLTISSMELAVQPAEDARADAGDKEDPVLLQVGIAVKGPGQHLLRGDKHAQRLGKQGDGGRSWISMSKARGLRR